jgi:hypothetical protein
MRVVKLSCLPMLALLAGCATQVYHPTRNRAEQARDVKLCTDHGTLSAPYEPIAALNNAYECLEKKGYKRGRSMPALPS